MFFRPLILLSCTLSFACAQEIVSLDKIEVQETAMTLEERKESSISKRIVKSEELAQYGDLNALEMLKRTPGVTIAAGKKRGGAPGKGYTKVLVDGEEVSTSSSKRSSPLEQISPDMIERVEIMTNGSAEYTAEAIGGIVNIVLKKPKSDGLLIAKATGGVYGSSQMATLFGQYEKKSGKVSVMINATATDTRKDDTSSLEDTQSGVTTSQKNSTDSISKGVGMNTKVIYTVDKFNKYTMDGTLGYWYASADENSVATSLGATTKNSHETRAGDGYYYSLKFLGDHRIGQSMMIDWKLIAHESTSQMDKVSIESVAPSTVDQDDSTLFGVYGGNANLSYVVNTHFIKSGIEYKYSKNCDEVQTVIDGVDKTIPEDNIRMNQDKYAVYLQDEWSVSEAFVITPGIRYEKIDRDYGNVSSLAYFAPSLHALFKLTPNDNLRASVAKTVKLPRLDEISTSVNSSLSDNTIDHPDTTGNIDLTEETAISYELRAEHYFDDKGIVSMSGFYRDIDEKIEKLTYCLDADQNEVSCVLGRYVQKPKNAGEGKLWGVELELKKPLTSVLQGLGIWGNATLQNSTLHNNTTGFTGVIGETSGVVANIGIDHSYAPYRLTYGVGYRYDGGFDDPIDQSGIEKSQKAFGVLDLYATKKLDSTFKLTFNAKNITSETIKTTSNRYVSGALVQTQIENENSQPQFLLTLEGRW